MPTPINTISQSTVSQIKPLIAYVNKQRDNEKFAQSLEIAGTFILITFFLIFAIRPTATAISNLLGEIKAKQLMAKELKTKINNIIIAQSSFADIQQQYDIINSALPDRPAVYQATNQLAGALNQVSSVPERFNIIFRDSAVSDQYPNLRSFTIASPLPLSFSQSLGLLGHIYNERRLIGLPNVSIFSVKNPTEGNQTNFTFSADYYYWYNDNAKK